MVIQLYAQKYTIRGYVNDSIGNPLKSVNVRLVTGRDTVTQATNQFGQYVFNNLNADSIKLLYSILGHKNENRTFSIYDKRKDFEIPLVVMFPNPLLISDVRVLKIIPIVVNGDTVQFNFGAFDFRKNSLLEDGLKRLPGFQVSRDGSVYYNGKSITRVKVDNKDFFGGDLLTATKNLPVDFIQNIQVIDFHGDKEVETGISTNEPDKIINITLKEDKKKIYFGQLTSGGGTNERYLGSLGLNKFDDGKEVSMLASINNTNTNLYSFGDLAGGDRGRSPMDIGEYVDPVDGLNNVGSAGINISDKIGNRSNFTASYNYLKQKNVTNGYSQLTSSYIGNTISRKEDYVMTSEDQSHRIKIGFDTKFENKDILKFNGVLALNNLTNLNNKSTRIQNYQKSNLGSYQDSSAIVNPNGDLELLYSKFFKKKGRKLIGQFGLNSNKTNRRDYVSEEYFEHEPSQSSGTISEFSQNQFVRTDNYNDGTKASLSFVEPFFQNSLFEFTYDFDITRIYVDRIVENRVDPNNIHYVDSLRVDYNYYFRSNRTGIIYQYEPSKRLKMNMGFAVQPLYMEGILPKENVKYTYENINLIPTANFIYRFTTDMDWQINYKGKNNQPYFNQIAPVVDNTNSRNIVIGNPELKAEFAHKIATTVRKTFTTSMQYFEIGYAYNFIINKIVSDKKTLENSTIQETTFKNTTGYYDWRLNYIFNTPFIHDNFALDLTGTIDYYNNLSFIDNQKRTTNQFILSQSAQLKYMLNEYFESNLNTNYTWNRARYDIPYHTELNIETWFWGLGARGYLNDRLSLGLEMSQRYNDGYRNSFMNVNQTVMNGFLEYRFLANKSAMLRLQGFDLFNQNQNMGIYSEYIGNDVYEARNNRLGRYFMLSLNVRLQKLPK